MVDDNVLDPKRWVSMKEDQKAPKNGTVQLPPPLSISYRLIKDWADGDGLTKRAKESDLKRILDRVPKREPIPGDEL
jgi:hypothetical protein